MSLKINPFIDFYMNCYLNNIFSLLCSIEKSFQSYAYLNDYSYQLSELESNNKVFFVRVRYSMDFYRFAYNSLFNRNTMYTYNSPREFMIESFKELENDHFSKEAPNMRTEDSMLFAIKSFINEGNIVFVGVDLYDLIKRSPLYHRVHRNHYMLVYNYDSKTNSFLSIDEGAFGYGPQIISESTLRKAMKDSRLTPECIFFIPKRLQPISLNLSKIINNADTIIKSIEMLEVLSLYDNGDNVRDNAYELRKISERQKGNQLLFQYLSNNKHVCEADFNYLKESAEALRLHWLNESNILLRYSQRGLSINISERQDKYKKLLQTEVSVWDYFINKYYSWLEA